MSSLLLASIEGDISPQWQFEIYQADGRVALIPESRRFDMGANKQRYELATEALAPGWYIMVARNGRQLLRKKLVKLQ